MLPFLLIRADANTEIGNGHAMRALALAQEWKVRGGDAEIFMATSTVFAVSMIHAAGVKTRDRDMNDVAREIANRPTVVVIDGYRSGRELEYLAHEFGAKLVVRIDDREHVSTEADLWVSPSGVHSGLAPAQLVGLRYALLRREFTAEPPPFDPESRRVFIAHDCWSDAILDALQEAGYEPVRHSATDPRSAMIGCQFGYCSGGVTALELAACGVPTVLMPVSDDQCAQTNALIDAGAAVRYGDGDDVAAASIAARRAVDGRGAERVARVIAALSE